MRLFSMTHPLERPRRNAAATAAFALLAAISVGAPLRAAPAEVRGTWLTTTGPDHIRSGASTENVMGDLRDVGINTVYVETWKNGYTNYPSQTLADLTGGPDRSPFLGSSRDLVEETLIHAHRNEMIHVGWFEYGFAAEFVGNGGNTFTPLGRTMRDNGWLLRDQAGQLANGSNGFAWMNPAVPEVRQFLIDITLEAVDRYDLDGVQFDDRLAWPREFGWDATTAAIYQQETGRSLPSSVDDFRFREWRQDKVTLFAQELTAAIDAVRPDLHLSVSPSVTNFSDLNFNAEWPQWQNAGLFDEYAVQVYRDNLASFNATLPGQTNQFLPNDLDEFVVGLRGNGSGANTPYNDLEAMIEQSRSIGAAGHSIFYSKAVRDDYDNELTAFYDVAGEGHASNPLFAPDHRPAPLESFGPVDGDQWFVLVEEEGPYRVIAEFNNRWEEVASGWFSTGLRQLTLPGASEVELLVDRSPVELADANGDGIVDAADFTIWRDTAGSTSDLRADFSGDGVVGALDYELWEAAFGISTAGLAAAATPEPSAVAVCVLGLAALSVRRGPR